MLFRSVIKCLEEENIDSGLIKRILKETPSSAILYDDEGKRQIYCDLKDIQSAEYPIDEKIKNAIKECDIAIICNTNYNRNILKYVKSIKIPVATDVHVLNDIEDEYNKEFMENADILFLSDEQIEGDHEVFISKLKDRYRNLKIVVLGRGNKGAMMYTRNDDMIRVFPAVELGKVVNTVGAGDALFSAFVNYYSKGFTPIDAINRAQIFASYKIGFNGAANGFISEERVEELFNNI